MPIEAFMDDRLSKTDLRVLGAILSYADKSGVCWPKREQIADRCGLPLTRISTSSSNLVALGWLVKEGNGGCSRSSHYKILTPNLGVKTVTDLVTVTESVIVGVTESVTGIKQTIELTKRERVIRTYEETFENFWSAYPKKKSKGDALKAWLKINPDEQLQQTIIAAVLLATTQDFDWQKDGGQFIPHASTYLNGKRWEDEITQKNQGNVAKKGLGNVTKHRNNETYASAGRKLSLVEQAAQATARVEARERQQHAVVG